MLPDPGRASPSRSSSRTELAGASASCFVCGRYEGFDERVLARADLELSIGDYVLTGGELPAMVVIDAVTRLLPGVLGRRAESSVDESFAEGLLEYPQYTRPADVSRPRGTRGAASAATTRRIAAWRREQAIRKTARVRPDLLARAALTDAEREIVAERRARQA